MIQSLAETHTLKVRLKLVRALAARPWLVFFTMFRQMRLAGLYLIFPLRLAEEVGDLIEKLRESDEQLQAGIFLNF